MMKQGREVRTNISEVFRTSYGTVDVAKLKSVYLNLSSWVEPKMELESWNRTIDSVKFKINNVVHKELLKTDFKNKAIVDLDLRASGLRPGKRSFMRCEITIFLKKQKESDIKHEGIYKPLKEMTDKIINGPLLSTKTFRFHKTKK